MLTFSWQFRRPVLALAGVVMVIAVGAFDPAGAQGAPPPGQQPPPVVQAAPPDAPPPIQPQPPQNPGLLNEMGRFFSNSFDNVSSSLKGAGRAIGDIGDRAGDVAKDAAKGAADVAKGASDSVVTGIPLGGTVVKGRQRCEVAANGSPDCITAADKLCKTKGYGGGRSVDTETAKNCPAQAWLGGNGRPEANQCRLETSVTRASCQ